MISKRLEIAIEKVIYWKNAYDHSRDKFNETNDSRYAHRMDSNHLHILASAKGLKRIYEEETGKEITTIGNLPEVEILNESVI